MRSLHFGLTAAVVCLSMIFADLNQAVKPKRGKDTVEKMPRFTYYTLEGHKFSNKNLDEDKNYLFVYFNPLCELCRNETEQIIENLDYLNDVQVLMVSPTDRKEIEQFVKDYKLPNYPQIKVLHDSEDKFYMDFGAIGYPNMYIYNTQGEMVAYFDRATDFHEIRQALKPVLTKK